MKFQRKPVIVDAEMFPELGDLAACGKFYQWLTHNAAQWKETKTGNIWLTVGNGLDEDAARPGDWVVHHGIGNFSVVGPELFWKLYERVPPE